MRRSSLQLSLMALVGATVATLSSNCLPDLHPLVGRPCDSVHACVDADLVCCEGTCQLASSAGTCPAPGGDGGSDGGLSDGGAQGDGGLPDAGPSDGGCPPNLLPSGSFELNADADQYGDTGAGLAGWTGQVTRTGTGALLVDKDPNDSNTIFGIELRSSVLTSLEVGPTYCMAAWIGRGPTTNDLPIDFSTRRYGSTGSEQTANFGWTITDNNWRLYMLGTNLTSQYNRSLTFRIFAPSEVASRFYVDDARVWKSPDGTCDERCAP